MARAVDVEQAKGVRPAVVAGLRSGWSMFVSLFWKCGDDRVLGLAAETAFFGVLSLFPGLLMIAAALGSLDTLLGANLAASVEAQVLDFLHLVLTDQASGAVTTIQQLFERQQGGVLTFAFLLALITLSGAFAALVSSLNVVYGVPESRSWWFRRYLGIVLAAGTVLLGAVVLAIVVVGPLFGRGHRIARAIGLGDHDVIPYWGWLRWPVLLIVLVAWATTLCHVAPSRRTAWRRDLPGGALAAILWLIASYGFNVYLRLVVRGNPVFGALGGGLIVMSWLYLLSLSMVLGGEVNALLLRRRRATNPDGVT
ncbi:MAG: hypothetical protein NVSMB13_14160 [Mycobacteriales bacterium]